jgi:hypothetical protein
LRDFRSSRNFKAVAAALEFAGRPSVGLRFTIEVATGLGFGINGIYISRSIT